MIHGKKVVLAMPAYNAEKTLFSIMKYWHKFFMLAFE